MTLRVGVVGLGIMGRRHAAALQAMDDVTYVGGADHDTPLDELLALGVDACVVATPARDHVHTATALARVGVPTLVEKPLAMDPAGCAAIEAAFSAAGVPAAVGHVERFHPAIRALRESLLHGEVGDVTRVATYRLGGPPRRRDGGVLLDLGVHDFDLTRWLTARDYEDLSAGPLGDAPTAEAVSVAGWLGAGIETSHAVSWCAESPARGVEVLCTAGVLTADTLDPGPTPPVPAQLRAFVDLVLGRLDPADPLGCASLGDGAYAVEVATLATQRLTG